MLRNLRRFCIRLSIRGIWWTTQVRNRSRPNLQPIKISPFECRIFLQEIWNHQETELLQVSVKAINIITQLFSLWTILIIFEKKYFNLVGQEGLALFMSMMIKNNPLVMRVKFFVALATVCQQINLSFRLIGSNVDL